MTTDKPQPRLPAEQDKDSRRPILRVIKGDATPEEIAALVAVVAALGSSANQPPKRPAPAWSAHHRKVRTTLPHGPGGWRSSALPH